MLLMNDWWSFGYLKNIIKPKSNVFLSSLDLVVSSYPSSDFSLGGMCESSHFSILMACWY